MEEKQTEEPIHLARFLEARKTDHAQKKYHIDASVKAEFF